MSATKWIVSRGGKEALGWAEEGGQKSIGPSECVMVDAADYDRDTSALRQERDEAQELARIMTGRADRVSLFLSAFANLVAAGMSVRVPDDQIPESGVFTVVAKARHCREFNAAMKKALDADRPPNYLSDRLQEVETELAAVRAVIAEFLTAEKDFHENDKARSPEYFQRLDRVDYWRGKLAALTPRSEK